MRSSRIAQGASAAPVSTGQRRWWLYLLLGLFCTLLFVIATLPAYWLDRALKHFFPDTLRIENASGTVWNGSGNLLVRNFGQDLMQTGITWSVQPLWLLAGKLQVKVAGPVNAPRLQATVRVGYRYLYVDNVDATLPASVAAVIHPAVSLVAPTGRVQIVSDKATLTPAGLEGQVNVNWLGAGAGMSGLAELGDYRFTANGRGALVGLQVETLRGEVGIKAQGQWQAVGDGLLNFSGTLTPGAREQNLRPLLTMANIQSNNGQYNFTLNNRFSLARVFGANP